MTRITVDEWKAALEEAGASRSDAVPKGWIIMAEFARRINKAVSTAQQDMRLLIDTGKAESRTFRIQTGRRVLPVPHYRLKK